MPYLDLELKVRTDGQFRDGLAKRSIALETARSKNGGSSANFNAALWDLLKFCKFNMIYLAGFFWPKYPKSKPMTFGNFPFAFQMLHFQIGGYQVFRGSRQIAKSSALTVRQLLNARLIPGWVSMYICPSQKPLQTYANRLLEMQRNATFSNTITTKFRNNLYFKEFPNRSRIELIHVNTTANNARSKSTDEALYDESQSFDSDLFLEVKQCQSASETPVTIFSGTSLTTDTFLEHQYSLSSQASWVTKCQACNHFNIPLLDHGIMDMIQPQGFSCCKCGRLLNPRTGQFVHQFPRLIESKRLGFHVPQIVTPFVLNNPIRWAEICENKIVQDTRHYLQEILGIPVEQGERELTKQQLMDICDLGADLRPLHEKARAGQYNYVISGMDWGGSDYLPELNMKVSTTVHCIVGVKSTGQIDILHFRRYMGMNYDDIVAMMLADHSRLSGGIIASDFGVGQLYNSKIRERVGPEKHIIFNYTGPMAAFLSEPKGAHMFNQWSLNKTESISMTYEAIRKKRIHCFAWEKSGEFLLDCLNMYRAPAEKRGETGMVHFVYRSHPTKPNDSLQALNYAFMMAKVMLGEPMFADRSLKVRMDNLMRSSGSFINGQGSMPTAFSS